MRLTASACLVNLRLHYTKLISSFAVPLDSPGNVVQRIPLDELLYALATSANLFQLNLRELDTYLAIPSDRFGTVARQIPLD